MKIFKSFNILNKEINFNHNIGFIPTMGSLHKGHLSLIEEAKNNNNFVIATIFINPTQFNNKKDYNSYPQTFENDVEKLKSLNCDLLYLPEVTDIYPKGLIREKSITKYRDILCDKFRPGHFDGVTTVVDTFFNIIKPNNSYFGEKDFQQVKYINELVKIKNHKINVISCLSVRDNLGMSLSSRNSKLNKDQLEIFKNLAKKISRLIVIIKQRKTKIELENFKKDLSKININKIDYFEIRDEDNLSVTDDYAHSRLFIALYIDEIRIIDNFKLY